MSFLDDLTLATPVELAREARDAVIKEFHAVGLSMNVAKSLVATPAGVGPPGCEDWWGNVEHHDGFLVCGRPYDADIDDMSFEGSGDAAVLPIGHALSTTDSLQSYVSKVREFADCIRQVVDNVRPGEPGVQVANLLLRHCTYQKAAHLLRTLPPNTVRGMASDSDDIVVQCFALHQGPGWPPTGAGRPRVSGGLPM